MGSSGGGLQSSGPVKKTSANTGPAGFFGDFFAVRNAQPKESRPVVVAREENNDIYTRFST